MSPRPRFEELMFDTPECNDLRKLGDGSWVAYSTKLDFDTGEAIRFVGASIREAVEGLRLKLKE